MEAKVDIRKLQLLNDRMSQMIEALHQVRLSVYGLSHTGNPGLPSFGPTGYGVQPFGIQPFGLQTLGIQPYGIPSYGIPPYGLGFQPPIGLPGLSHTPAIPGLNPFVAPLPTLGVPGLPLAGVSPFVHPFVGATQAPLLPGYPLGLSHTSPELLEQRLMEARASDPIRLAQTFPFSFAPQPTYIW